MELLNMFEHHAVRLWAAQVIVVFFLIGGIFLLAVGMSLIVNSAGALRFFGSMNRWVSMRRATRPLEIPRDTRQAVQKYRYWLAAIFVAGGVFAIVGLVTRFDTSAVITMFGLNFLRANFAAWLIDGVRWVLIVGNVTAIVAGIMLAFFPGAVVSLEAHGSHWYSERQLTRGADSMHPTLDTWVAAYPRATGAIIALFALVLIGAFALMAPGFW